MNKIEVGILQEPSNAKYMSPLLARLTQRGHQIQGLSDLYTLAKKPSKEGLQKTLASMQHGTIKRFDSYTVAVVGASRRFLAQIRTHQHADFVSGSLQYSDWSDFDTLNDWSKMFVVPYPCLEQATLREEYLRECSKAFNTYKLIAEVDNDAAGYVMPNGLRNVLIIQANVQQWQYMIKLRACRRNSDETRYVLLQIWHALLNSEYGDQFFSPDILGFDCQFGGCKEGKFSCGHPYSKGMFPMDIIKAEYPLCLED